jgi:hypothetical protein
VKNVSVIYEAIQVGLIYLKTWEMWGLRRRYYTALYLQFLSTPRHSLAPAHRHPFIFLIFLLHHTELSVESCVHFISEDAHEYIIATTWQRSGTNPILQVVPATYFKFSATKSSFHLSLIHIRHLVCAHRIADFPNVFLW